MGNLETFLFYPFADFTQRAVGEKPYPMTSQFVAPAGDYLGFKIISINPISWSEGAINPSDDSGLSDIFTVFEASVRLVGYGDSALTKVQSIVHGFRERNLRKILVDKDIAYFGHSPVRDTSFGYDDKIEIRYETVIQFRFIQGGTDRGIDPSIIETANGVDSTYN